MRRAAMRFTYILLVEIISANTAEIFDCSLSKFPSANISSHTPCQQGSTVEELLPGCFFDKNRSQYLTCKMVCWGEAALNSRAYNRCRYHCPGHMERYCRISAETTQLPLRRDTAARYSTDKPPRRETNANHFTENPLIRETNSKNYTENPLNRETTSNNYTENPLSSEKIAMNYTGKATKGETTDLNITQRQQKSSTTMDSTVNLPNSRQTKEYARENHSNYGFVAGTVFGGALFIAVLIAAIMLLCCCCCQRCHYFELLKGLRKPKALDKDQVLSGYEYPPSNWLTDSNEWHKADDRRRVEPVQPPTPSKISIKPSPFYSIHKGALPDAPEKKLNPLYNIQKTLLDKRQEPKPNPLYDMHKCVIVTRQKSKPNPLCDMEEGRQARRHDQNHNTEKYESLGASRYSTHIYAEILEISDASCYEVSNQHNSCK